MNFPTFNCIHNPSLYNEAFLVQVVQNRLHLVPTAKEYVNCYILLSNPVSVSYHSSFTINLLNHHENNNILTKKATGLL